MKNELYLIHWLLLCILNTVSHRHQWCIHCGVKMYQCVYFPFWKYNPETKTYQWSSTLEEDKSLNNGWCCSNCKCKKIWPKWTSYE